MPKLVEGFADRMKVPAGKRDALVFDDELAGFGIRKFASGAAFYFIKFSVAGRTKRISLGEVVRGSLKSMRLLASEVKARARLGQDVLAEKRSKTEGKQAARTAATLGTLIPVYLRERQDDLSDKTHHETERYLMKCCAPLHHLVVGTVTRGDQAGVVDIDKRWTPINGHKFEVVARSHVVHVIDSVAKVNGKTAADRAKTSLSSFFGWCIDRGFCDFNPTANIKPRATNGSRERVLTERELAEVWRATRDDEYGNIVRLLLLTGQRRAEIGDLSWPEIDLDKRQIELPGSRTKNGKDHVVPLSNEALAIIKGIPVSKTRSLLFGIGSGGFGGFSRCKRELDDRIAAARAKAGLSAMKAWTVHDLRRSFATHVNDLGFGQPHAIEAVLNHISGGAKQGVAGVYNRASYAKEKRQLLERWGAHVAQLVRKPLPEAQRAKARKPGRSAPKAARVTAA